MSQKYNFTLDIWKLIAALLIMGHHAVQIGQDGDYIFHGAYIYTEFFFMISGFYLIKSLEEKILRGGVLDYAKKMWIKLFPYTTAVISIYYVLISIESGSIKECIKIWMKWPSEICYINTLHIFTSQVGQLWYIGSMLFIMPIICWLFFKDKSLFEIVSYAVPLIWYGYCYMTWGHLGHRGVFVDLIRAFSNLLLGGEIYYISKRISEYSWLLKYKWINNIIAWGTFNLTIWLTYRFYWSEYDIQCIVLLFIALIFIQSEGFVDFHIKKYSMFSDLSMAIYLVHVPVGSLVQRYCNGSIVRKYVLYYGISIICAILLLLFIEKLKRIRNSYVLKHA